MSAATLITVLESTILTFAMIALLCWLWPAMRLDAFRQDMFAIRDELFDYAASGKIEFSHPAYRLLRQSMNGFIRHAHRLSFFQIVMDLITWKVIGGAPALDWTNRWNRALASLDDRDAMAALVRFHERANQRVSRRIVLGSPILAPVLVICLVLAVCQLGLTSLGGMIKPAMSKAAAQIIDPRLLDEQAAKAA